MSVVSKSDIACMLPFCRCIDSAICSLVMSFTPVLVDVCQSLDSNTGLFYLTGNGALHE